MLTLKAIINALKIIGISIAGISFIVFMIKIAIEPEYKQKYIKYTKHLLIATVFITISLSLVELPKNYYGSTIEIVDEETSKTTIAELKDADCQGRETINIEGKWYVVTDSKQNINALEENGVFIRGTAKTNYSIDNVSFLRLFSECQGTFKGYFADVKYYRDSDGFIFPATYTYAEYQNAKSNKWWR